MPEIMKETRHQVPLSVRKIEGQSNAQKTIKTGTLICCGKDKCQSKPCNFFLKERED